MADKPKVTSSGQAELDKVEKQFEAFDKNVQELTLDRMNTTPKVETAPQVNLSQDEIKKTDVYLKPKKIISSKDKFNEKFRSNWEFDKQYVQFIAEHKEIIGDSIEIWTRPYGGVNAEFWEVPTNKPLWGPRYLAEQIKRAAYHRLTMQQSTVTGGDGIGQYYGQLAVDSTVQRLDARPVSSQKSFFMGARNFG